MADKTLSLLTILTQGWRAPEQLQRQLEKERVVRVVTAFFNRVAPLLAAKSMDKGRQKILLITHSRKILSQVAHQVRSALDLAGLGGVAVVTLPEVARSPYDELPLHAGLQSARAEAVSHLYGKGSAVIVTPVSALRWGIVKPERFEEQCTSIEKGDSLNQDELAERLVRAGYIRRELVSEPGEFAIRGYIIDLYSPDRGLPARIEMYGDEVESLRTFNPATQRSLGPLNSYRLIPLRSMPMTHDEEAELRAKLVARGELDDEERAERHEQLHRGEEAPWLWRERISEKAAVPLWEVVPGDCLIIVSDSDKARAALDEQASDWQKQSNSKGDVIGGLVEKALNLKEPLAEFTTGPVLELVSLELSGFGEEKEKSQASHISLGLSPLLKAGTAFEPMAGFLKEMDSLKESGSHALAVLQTEGHVRRVADLLFDRGMKAITVVDPAKPPGDVLEALQQQREGTVLLTIGELERGFAIDEIGLKLFGHADLFGGSRLPSRPVTSRAAAFTIPLHELREGDFIVHEDHGIGKFDGLKTIRRDEEVRDFMQLLYRDGDRLLIPVDSLAKVQKYSTIEGVRPRLDKLGGTTWQKVKRRVKRAIREMAGELLNLYAVRRTINGFGFPADGELLREFERSFPYQETPDQLSAMEEIKADMESEKPMDRLLCGDVGFGKTELAIRAAVKATEGKKQVGILAPTTVLARQHYDTFSDRLRGFPFTVEMISRFRSRAKQKDNIERLAAGKIDIIVGTHRLLSKDVKFRDLGLLVIDEEQRFGVRHKEQIKQMRRRVDVLSLTATPIPRTLNMSLMGIRDMSLIQTPPRNRLAIQTKVIPYSHSVIRAAIEGELAREGQVFYLRNQVEGIETASETIRELVPYARPAIAHAQMSSSLLEKVMSDFVQGRTNVLISTTIIENGLDIPRANTLIVENADRFGLAQLYQIRGRVGRSEREAYAYLLVPPSGFMTSDARRRLQAIREFSDLGSGFRIAAMDLEIRGAGNLLGGEQSGHIEAVGFDLYNRLLERTVAELRGEKVSQPFEARINLNFDLHIPNDYIADTGTKMKFYQRAADATGEAQLEELREEIIDLYGPLPPSVGALLRHAAIALLAKKVKIEKVERSGKRVSLKFSPESEVNSQYLAELVQGSEASFTTSGVLYFNISGESQPEMLEEIYWNLLSLSR